MDLFFITFSMQPVAWNFNNYVPIMRRTYNVKLVRIFLMSFNVDQKILIKFLNYDDQSVLNFTARKVSIN